MPSNAAAGHHSRGHNDLGCQRQPPAHGAPAGEPELVWQGQGDFPSVQVNVLIRQPPAHGAPAVEPELVWQGQGDVPSVQVGFFQACRKCGCKAKGRGIALFVQVRFLQACGECVRVCV